MVFIQSLLTRGFQQKKGKLISTFGSANCQFSFIIPFGHPHERDVTRADADYLTMLSQRVVLYFDIIPLELVIQLKSMNY